MLSRAPRRFVRSSLPKLRASAAEADAAPAVLARFQVTAEVTVSKLFPAGVGWQAAAAAATAHGLGSTDVAFFAVAGAGDGLGVFGGHLLFYGIKKVVAAPSINMAAEAQTAALLGSAAFLSGFAWQPIVNALQGADASFNAVALGTAVGCGGAFFAGLRVFRGLYGALGMRHIAPPTSSNLMKDANLSMSIGVATGAFVGTDTAYKLPENWLEGVVGIYERHSPEETCLLAGASTSLGFAAAQLPHNFAVPHGKSWQD